MIVSNKICELISKRDNRINYIDQIIATGERLSEAIHSYARTELDRQSIGRVSEGRIYSQDEARNILQDNQKFSERIKTIEKEISRIDHHNSSNILNTSTEDLHLLFHENEEKIRSLEKEYEEPCGIHLRVSVHLQMDEQAIEVLREERANIASALREKQKAIGAKELTTVQKTSAEDLPLLFHENGEKIRSLEKEYEESCGIHSSVSVQLKKDEKAIEALRKEKANIAEALRKEKANIASALEKQKAERVAEQRQKATRAKERTIIRKGQVRVARWWLIIVALGLIASRLITWGG